jgi:hypothetical protein
LSLAAARRDRRRAANGGGRAGARHDELRLAAGTQFDPAVVDALLGTLDRIPAADRPALAAI